jgi:hypothetical protein
MAIMPTSSNRRTVKIVALLLTGFALGACTPSSTPEPGDAPVVLTTRRISTMSDEQGTSYATNTETQMVVGKLVAPAPAVWEALLATFTARKITPNLVDRPAGRVGDTAIVAMRRFNGQPLSRYLSCGASITGQRADEEKVHAILVAQISKLSPDTISIAVHFSGYSQPVTSGNSGAGAPCTSTGKAETELLDDVMSRARAAK